MNDHASSSRAFPVVLAMTLAGLLIWAVHFLFVYGFNALACARRFADAEWLGFAAVPLAVGVATAVAALGAAGVLLAALRHLGTPPSDRSEAAPIYFLRWMAASAAGLSLVAILWAGLAAAVVPACA